VAAAARHDNERRPSQEMYAFADCQDNAMTAARKAPERKAGGVTPARKPAGIAPERDGTAHLGPRLRHYRLMRKLKLKELAELASCSESFLSRIENSQINPSFSTLHRLCKALDIGIANMVAPIEESPCVITRPGERVVVGRGNYRDLENSEAEILVPYADGRLLEGLLVTLEPGGHSNGFVSHRGEEVGYILEGEFELVVDQTTYLLGAGSTFHFRSDIPHSYRNPGERTTRVVWINTPPTF
jgi:transcriptional regulator with XRE-family HTH domain